MPRHLRILAFLALALVGIVSSVAEEYFVGRFGALASIALLFLVPLAALIIPAAVMQGLHYLRRFLPGLAW
jgi:hypothetical protein